MIESIGRGHAQGIEVFAHCDRSRVDCIRLTSLSCTRDQILSFLLLVEIAAAISYLRVRIPLMPPVAVCIAPVRKVDDRSRLSMRRDATSLLIFRNESFSQFSLYKLSESIDPAKLTI